MGTQDIRYGTTGNLKLLEQSRSFMQEKIDNEKDIEERRRLGQFSTPFDLAKEIVKYGIEMLGDSEVSFLEPCIGSGAFYSALLCSTNNDKIKMATGIEIDKSYFDCSEQLWRTFPLELIEGDFTRVIPHRQYNFIVTNPPYVRHHYLCQEDKTYLIETEKNETGIALSGLAGLYCHFMLLAHKWLAPNAICGWLIPSEFMDVNYGNALKQYLLKNVHLLRIHRYSPESSLFSDALVSSCVVWFKNEIIDSDYEVEFSFGGTHEKPDKRKGIKKSDLLKERKWTRFPEKEVRNSVNTGNTLGDFFEIKRGLATGDNNFFILDREQIAKLGMEMSFFKPILPSPRYLKTDLVTSDSKGVPQIDPQFFLLNCYLSEEEIKEKHPAIWGYLQSGLEKTSKKYLCRSRKKWYWQEQRSATNFLCSYMGRGSDNGSPIRFILNLSDAIVTNSYLMLYPKERLQRIISDNPDSIYRIWESLKAIGGDEIKEEGRVYGGGLKKIEPRELAKVPCCDMIHLCLT